MATPPLTFGFLSQLVSIHFPSGFLLLQTVSATTGKANNDPANLYGQIPGVTMMPSAPAGQTSTFWTPGTKFTVPGVPPFNNYPKSPFSAKTLNQNVAVFGPGFAATDTQSGVSALINLAYFTKFNGKLSFLCQFSPCPVIPPVGGGSNTITAYYSVNISGGVPFIFYTNHSYTGPGANPPQIPSGAPTSQFCGSNGLDAFDAFVQTVSTSANSDLPMILAPTLASLQPQLDFLNANSSGGWFGHPVMITFTNKPSGGCTWEFTAQLYNLQAGKQAGTLLLPTFTRGIPPPQMVLPDEKIVLGASNNPVELQTTVTYDLATGKLTATPLSNIP